MNLGDASRLRTPCAGYRLRHQAVFRRFDLLPDGLVVLVDDSLRRFETCSPRRDTGVDGPHGLRETSLR